MLSKHLILFYLLLLLLSIFPSMAFFSNELTLSISGQSIGPSASASVLPMNIKSWFPLGLTGLISLQSKGLSSVFSSTTVHKHQFFSTQPFLHLYMPTGKTIVLSRWIFVGKVMSLLFNMLSRQRNQRSNCEHPLDHRKSKRVPEKHLFLLYWLCQSLWLCGSQ